MTKDFSNNPTVTGDCRVASVLEPSRTEGVRSGSALLAPNIPSVTADYTRSLVVYDWNGTLLDDVDVSFECFKITLDMLGAKAPTVEEYIYKYDMPIIKLYTASGVPEQEFIEKRDSIYHTFFSNYKQRAHKARTRAHAPEVLSLLHAGGVKQVIASNDVDANIKFQLNRFNIHPFISEVIAFSDMESRKLPKGELLRRYMEKEGVNAHKTIIVGDVVEEIDIARDLGLISVAITGGYVDESRLRAANPDYLIHSLKELEPILIERRLIGEDKCPAP